MSQLPWLYSYEQYSVHLLRISCSSATHFQTCPGQLRIYPVSLRLDTSPAGMLCYCCFCSGKFNLCALSTYPVLLCFLHCLLNPLVCFPIVLLLLLHTCTISSRLIKEVENISGDPWHFPVTFIPKYLTGCISHCCIVGGNHGNDVHVLISQTITSIAFTKS